MRVKFLILSTLAGVFTGAAFAGMRTGTLQAQVNRLDAVRLELGNIASDGDRAEVETSQFEPGQRVRFRLLATNDSSEVVNVPLSNPYYQNRPHLRSSGGEEIAYRADIAKLVKAKDAEAVPTFVSIRLMPLRPYERRELETIDLSAWYPKLKPGVYELRVSHRFEQGETWVDLSPVTFEVVTRGGDPDGPRE